MSDNPVYILGNHKLTREPIYVASGEQLITYFYTNNFEVPTAVGINGWYNEERPYSESELQELDLQEALRSPYLSEHSRGLISSPTDIYITHSGRAALASEMNMFKFIPIDMVDFKPGTQAYESINFKPIKREGSLIHVKFPKLPPDHCNMYKDATSFKINHSISDAFSIDDNGLTIDLDKLRTFFLGFIESVTDSQEKFCREMTAASRKWTQSTHLRYQERAKVDLEINTIFRGLKTDTMDDIEKFIKLLDALDDETSVVDLCHVILEINRINSGLDNRCVQYALKQMIRAMGTDLISVITQLSTPITSPYSHSRQIVSISSSGLIAGSNTITNFISAIKDVCVSDSTPDEVSEILDASAELLDDLVTICKFVQYDLLTLAGYQYIIKA